MNMKKTMIFFGAGIFYAHYSTSKGGGTNNKIGSYGEGYKDGYHLNSSYWKNYKLNLKEMPAVMMEL